VQRSVLALSVVAFVAAAATAALFAARLPHGDAGPSDDPGRFVSRVVTLVLADDYSAAWASLHPAHQEVAPRGEYVACELRTPVGANLRSIDVVRIADRSLHVPGEQGRIAAKAVTLRITLENEALRENEVFSHTFNAVAVDSHWAWILTPDRFRLYRTNAC
jgi:hypothetical protein